MTPEEIKADLREQKRDILNGLNSGVLRPIEPRTGHNWFKRLAEIDQQLDSDSPSLD